jgi:hypothetical protein
MIPHLLRLGRMQQLLQDQAPPVGPKQLSSSMEECVVLAHVALLADSQRLLYDGTT